MTTVRIASSAEDIIRPTFFVEGSGEKAIDCVAIHILLEGRVQIEPLGSSFHVDSAAQALHRYHPLYYFLIDRDHHKDAFVEKCWKNFPDPNTYNLLVWRRREFENYFIDPEYALKSSWLKVKEPKLRASILKTCQKRLYIDVVNLVIVHAREMLKDRWIETFKRPAEFKTIDQALEKLLNAPEFSAKKKSAGKILGTKWLEKEFEKVLLQMTGGENKIEFGSGKWLEMIRGKEILPTVVNSCFQVEDRDGNYVQGKERMSEVIKDLVRKPEKDLPKDFVELRRLIFKRISN